MQHGSGQPRKTSRGGDARRVVRRALGEFLAVPSIVIVAFLVLAAGTYALDHAEIGRIAPFRRFMQERVFNNAQATSELLGTIASGLITVTSITFSLLLLAVQQSAASMTTQVFDQFLRRRLNQVSFGFFVGLALYALIILATVAAPYNPVYGASLALLLSGIALYLLLLLLYATIHQMRPSVIIESIHDHMLTARERHLAFVRRTRRIASYDGAVKAPVRLAQRGFITMIDLDAIEAATAKASGEVEVTLLLPVGAYVAFGDTLAEVRAGKAEDAARVGTAVADAVRLERQRDLDRDPAYGVEQLATIGWTSISTSKSNPDPGLATIHALRDLLARWSVEDTRKVGTDGEEARVRPAPVVYEDDLVARVMDALETLAVVSSESMQHQNFAEVVHTFVVLFDRLPPELQNRTEDLLRRILSALGDHVLTAELDTALAAMIRVLSDAGRHETAGTVQQSRDLLAGSIGRLNSRSTRVPAGGDA